MPAPTAAGRQHNGPVHFFIFHFNPPAWEGRRRSGYGILEDVRPLLFSPPPLSDREDDGATDRVRTGQVNRMTVGKRGGSVIDPVGFLHPFDAHDGVDQRVHDGGGRHLDVDEPRDAAAGRGEVHGADAQLEVAADDLGDAVYHARRVVRRDADGCAECSVGTFAPAGFDDPVGVVFP